MRIKSQRDFFAGLLFVALGIAFAWGATTMRIGSGQRMGPGWFPLVMGVLLAALGAFIVFGSLVVETEDGEPVAPWALRPLVGVLGANVLFGALMAGVPAIGLPAIGLIVSTIALTLVCALAGGAPYRAREAVLLAIVLAAAASLAFTFVLRAPLPLWPAFVAG